MARSTLFLAAISGFLTVAMGAFGAHALKTVLDENMMSIYKTAIFYQFVHTLVLLVIGLLVVVTGRNRWLLVSVVGFVTGILLFCGSLYVFAISGSTVLVMLTPVGGGAFLVGWSFLAVFAFNLQVNEKQ